MTFLQSHRLSITLMTGIILSSCSKTLTHSLNPTEGAMQEMVLNMNQNLIVDCVPPPRVKALGGAVFLRKSRPLRTSVLNCRNRGGEYMVNAPRKKRIEIWQAKANDGDVEAQTYLGEIYEKGIDRAPDYEFAAIWYKKAAEQGSRRAQNNLAFLYEKGFGVPKDPHKAYQWYQKAAGSTGLNSNERLNPAVVRELISLRNEISQKSIEAEQLHQQLETAQAKLDNFSQNKLLLEQNRGQRAQLEHQNQEYTDRLARLSEKINALEDELHDAGQTQERHTLLIERIAAKTQEAQQLRGQLNDSQGQLLQSQSAMANMQQGHVQQNDATAAEISLLNQNIDRLKRQLESATTVLEDDKKKFSTQIWKGVNFGKYHALIIGNNDYKNLSKLRTPVNDAKRLSTVLKQKYGFKTKLLLNVNRTHILDALGDYQDTLRSEDSLLIFYAGHGTLSNTRGFWQGVDSKPNRVSDSVSNFDISEIIEQMQAKHILVVVDSCYSGAFARGGTMQELNPDMQEAEQLNQIKQKLAQISRSAITSGGLEPVLDGSGKHSVFAHAFISHLENNKSVLGARSIFNIIEPRVMSRAQNIGTTQEPRYGRLHTAADENGEFYFKPVEIIVHADYYHFASLLWATEYVSLNL